DEANLEPRCPIVVVMGHVDHGKTSVLDTIRNTSVTDTEAGGITQHIGAYMVDINGEKITFLDTPGHAAFTSMRARGAMATDIAVLVVAADDGIMPQTVEAINHAKAAGVSMIVAINKMDKPEASPDRVMQQLTEYEVVPEEWGGDVICVPVSAKTGMNIDKLLESILLVAEMKELKANPNRAAKGVIIEARLDKGRGPIATLLVQNGTLNSGDIIVAGSAVGRVRVMTNENGKKVNSAGPSVPVEIMGLDDVPQAGDTFDAVSDEKLARTLVEQRKQKAKEEKFNAVEKVTLSNLFDSIQQGEMKELNIVVKADVQGSAEAVKQNLEKLSNDEVRVKVIHNGVGAINESDVMLAHASSAIIVGFNVRPDAVASANADRDSVEIRTYRIIYDCIEEVQDAIKGMLAPKFRENVIGNAEVRNVIRISSVGNIAGCYVTNGKVSRNAKIRVIRDGIVIAEDEISSLKRFKDDVKEVNSNYECGIGLNKYNDIKEGDVFEVFVIEEYRD
ncbi:MAG: translation initiation factor IF-2, partial [Clostridia bacterium]|nr:translation initiation factor IF-2 [Clostridia bacterium]